MEKINITDFNDFLKSELKAQGVSQNELSRRINMPVCSISLYANNKRQPSIHQALRIVNGLGYDLVVYKK